MSVQMCFMTIVEYMFSSTRNMKVLNNRMYNTIQKKFERTQSWFKPSHDSQNFLKYQP